MRISIIHFRAFMPFVWALLAVGQPHSSSAAEQVTIILRSDQPGPRISSTMWGAFFEDINFGADGGLYAELVKNGSFEFPDPMLGWFKISPSLAKGDITVETEKPVRENSPHYVRIASKAAASQLSSRRCWEAWTSLRSR
jgi:hypothetical protein